MRGFALSDRRRNALILAICTVPAIVVGWILWWHQSRTFLPLAPHVANAAGEFALARPAPVPRTEAGGTACAGRFYLAGGIGAFAQTFTSFASYDPVSDRWRPEPPLPEPLNHPGVVCADGKVYVVGGFGPLGLRLRFFMFARWDPRDSLYVFDPETARWKEGPRMPRPRGAGGVTLAEGALWYAGGIGEDLSVTDTLFRYDLERDEWTEQPPMPTARDHLRLEALDGALYAISGREDDLRRNLAVVERYDLSVQRWSRVADIPVARGGLASAVHGGYIYTFGGEFLWTCHQGIERYDPREDRWDSLGPLPEARHGICAGVLGDRIHLVTGGRHPRVSVSAIHRVYTPRPEGT